MEIRNLEHTDFDTVFQGFEKAFADYEIHFEKEEVHSMLQRRGYNPKLSFAAFANHEIVSFTLNGSGTFNGAPTFYDTGSGTVKDYRGQNIAGKMAGHCVFDAHTGDLAQTAVQNEHRRKGVASRLLHEATGQMKTDFIKVLNIDSDTTAIPVFLQNKNISLASRQFEMALPL